MQKHFNPRPRKEGDLAVRLSIVAICAISIHALVKRATNHLPPATLTASISIHALVKRATDTGKNCEIFNNYISIHALVKRATAGRRAYLPHVPISIHALVKRAT